MLQMLHSLYDIFINSKYRNICRIIELYVWQNRMKQAGQEIFKLMKWNNNNNYFVCLECGNGLFNWRAKCNVQESQHIYITLKNFKARCPCEWEIKTIIHGKLPKNY